MELFICHFLPVNSLCVQKFILLIFYILILQLSSSLTIFIFYFFFYVFTEQFLVFNELLNKKAPISK